MGAIKLQEGGSDMTYQQAQQLKQLATYLPFLRELELSISQINAKINEMNAKIASEQPKRGPTKGLAQLKKRVEQLENAIGLEDKVDLHQ